MKFILVCGLEHVIAKTARHYRLLGDLLETEVYIYSRDSSGLSRTYAEQFNIKWRKTSVRLINHIKEYIKLLMTLHPIHIELYTDSGNDFIHLGYLLFAHFFGIPIVYICRGGELLYWNQHKMQHRFVIWLSLRMAHLVLYKELHMLIMLRKLGVPAEKFFFFYNHIPSTLQEPSPASTRKGVLFLNTWKNFRHPEIAVEVALRLAKRYPDVRFTIAGDIYFRDGCSSRPEFDVAIRSAGLVDRIRLMGWVPFPNDLFNQHNIFILPAELVFLNYTLLEAMERGLVPVIAKADGSDRIIDHGKDGFIVDLSADAFVKAVEYLLSHPDEVERMAQAARAKIQRCFNLENGLRELIGVYQNKVWR